MNEFRPYNMGDFIKIKHGYPFKSKYFTGNGGKQATSLGLFYERGGFKYPEKGKEKFTIEQYSPEYDLKKGDMIIAMTEQVRGLLGAVARIPDDDTWILNQRCGLLTCYSDIVDVDEVFVYYLFATRSVREQISRPAQGTKQRNTSPESIYNVKVWLPEKSVQERIGQILDSIDRKIALNNRINHELEYTARTVYEYMFLREGQSQAGWKIEKLNNTSLCTPISTGIDYFDKKKIYLTTSEIIGKEIIDHTKTVDYYTRPARANMQPQMHSVWFAKMKNTRKHLLINESNSFLTNNYIFSTGFTGLKCSPNSVYYLWNYLNSEYFELQKDTIATGATQQAINDTDISGFSIIVPPEAKLKKFSETVEPYYCLINKLKFENTTLLELRDFLLPLLMNGQVSIGD